jgi:Type IV secretion-system coupling protein DNA-binding domain
MRRPSGNDLLIATSRHGEPLMLKREQRSRHLYVTGSTGSGKSKFLEYLICQDIANWRKSECGLLLLDPHGAIYDGLMHWLPRTSSVSVRPRPIIPIDLRRDDWVVAYNILRQRERVAASVVTDNLVDALTYVWGAMGTNQTPLFARIATTVFQALYDHKLTLVEALKILEFPNREFRATLARGTKDEATRATLEALNDLKASDYEFQIGSTRNRFQRLLRNDSLRAAFGQTEVSFDFGQALSEGAIVLVSLATEGGTVSQENASTFATLMLADLWTAAKERGKGTDPKPFYLYIDEFQRFVSPTIAENLDEARGFGLHLTLAHQYPSQLIEASRDYGQRLYESIMENARSKVVFSLSLRDRNLSPLADWFYSGTYDPHRVKHELYSRKVMDYTEETREILTYGTSRGSARSDATGALVGGGTVQRQAVSGGYDGVLLSPTHWSSSTSQVSTSSNTTTRGDTQSESESESRSEVPVFMPIFGEELASIQFLSLDEQRFLAEQRIMRQPDRHATARFLGMDTPVELRTPEVPPRFGSEERTEDYRREQLAKLPFVLSCEEAQARLEKRHSALVLPLITPETEPRSFKRRVPSRATMKSHVGSKDDTDGG